MYIPKTESDIKREALDCAKSCEMCFDWQSTPKWVEMFANKRYDTLSAILRYDFQVTLPKKYRKVYVDVFVKHILEVITQKQKEHDAKVKAEQQKKRQSHRKGKNNGASRTE